jgi:hypothetical protein
VTIENYLVIAIGLAAVVCGPLVTRRRVKISKIFVDAQRALGGPVGRATSRGMSPSWIGVIGVALAVIGLIAIGVGVFAREV